MPRSRTITRELSTLQLPGPLAPSFAFTDSLHDARITLPATSQWIFPYHWHMEEHKCEAIHFLPGGDVHFLQSLGVYRNSSTTARAGFRYLLRPGERSYWRVNEHRPHKEGDPSLEVLVRSERGAELWRNAVSATMDSALWPELATTPLMLRLMLRLLLAVPVVGPILRRACVEWALWVQLMAIYRRHEFWVWCGCVQFTWPWFLDERPPEWVSDAEWRSAEILAKLTMGACWFIGIYALGMRDTYSEYFNEDTVLGGGEFKDEGKNDVDSESIQSQ
ncbi:hypothetical protein F4777DRAFT_417146 [Nemania sp. FL0916]|nr:hypothetical protein F4777DRAFT_417146 [Nemania sp. FL0916]